MHLAGTGLLLAVTLPAIEIEVSVVVIAGVISTSTVATAPAAKVGIKQVIVDPCTAPQLPVPLVTFAVGVDANPEVGKLDATKVT